VANLEVSFVDDLVFLADRVVGNEKGLYWLSIDIVQAVGKTLPCQQKHKLHLLQWPLAFPLYDQIFPFPQWQEAVFPPQNVRAVVVGDTEGSPKCLAGVCHQTPTPQ